MFEHRINQVVGILMLSIPVLFILFSISSFAGDIASGQQGALNEDDSFYFTFLIACYACIGWAGYLFVTGKYPVRWWSLLIIPLWQVGTTGLNDGVFVPIPGSAPLQLLAWYLIQFPPVWAVLGLIIPPYPILIRVDE